MWCKDVRRDAGSGNPMDVQQPCATTLGRTSWDNSLPVNPRPQPPSNKVYSAASAVPRSCLEQVAGRWLLQALNFAETAVLCSSREAARGLSAARTRQNNCALHLNQPDTLLQASLAMLCAASVNDE